MKISDLMNRDFKLVEKKKIWFIIPACIIAVAIIVMIIFGCVTGSPLNLGMDFTGGYTVNVKLSTKLTTGTYSAYQNEIVDIIENLKDESGKSYGIKVAGVQQQGSGNDASIYVKYQAARELSDADMEEIVNPAIQEALQDKIFKIIPVVSHTDSTYTVTYSDPIVKTTFSSVMGKIKTLAETNGIAATNFTLDGVSENSNIESGRSISFTLNAENDTFASALQSIATIEDKYSGQAQKGDTISATVSGELLTNAILAICLAIVLMLVYIAFRFEISSGLSAIVALLHDILIMFSFMAIFHIEINSTFIAALITILGYSINNTIIIFDRIRENVKSLYYKNSTAAFIANQSVKDTLVRSVNTTLTTLITITMVAIIGVPSIRIFALPIIVGLLAGTFSSIFISPSIWALWKDRKKKSYKTKNQNKTEGQKAAIA